MICLFRCGTFDVCELSERLLCCGDFSGNLGLWDVETLVQTETCRAHADIVNSVAGGGVGSFEILTGKISFFPLQKFGSGSVWMLIPPSSQL